jgi:hypothetical protein
MSLECSECERDLRGGHAIDCPARSPQRGDIAVCSRGCLGVITSDGPERVNYGDGNVGEAYTGFHLSQPVGRPWSSRSPKVVGTLQSALIDMWADHVHRDPEVDKAFEEATRR